MDYFTGGIDLEIRRLQKLEKICRKWIKKLPKGRLVSEQKNGRTYYKIIINGSARRASASDPMVSRIKDRRFCEELSGRIAINIKLLENLRTQFRSTEPEICQLQLPRSYQGASEEIMKELGFLTSAQFHTMFKTDQDFRAETREQTVSNGLKVRSRIELAIAEYYISNDVDFVYEPPILLKCGKIVHPDFAVFSKSRNQVILHEHVGNLNDPEYRRTFEWKVSEYIKTGYIPMKNLFFTFDNDNGTIDMREMEKLLKNYIL